MPSRDQNIVQNPQDVGIVNPVSTVAFRTSSLNLVDDLGILGKPSNGKLQLQDDLGILTKKPPAATGMPKEADIEWDEDTGVIGQAVTQYPILKNMGLKGVYSYEEKPKYGGLEFWQPGEPGTEGYKRPAGIPIDQPGVQVWGKETRPIDVLADAVSHHLVKTDPVLKSYYDKFLGSLTDFQKAKLQKDYEYSKENEGETRPFKQWAEASRIPAFFRGYTFDQWPKDFTSKLFTKDQIEIFDNVRKYVGLDNERGTEEVSGVTAIPVPAVKGPNGKDVEGSIKPIEQKKNWSNEIQFIKDTGNAIWRVPSAVGGSLVLLPGAGIRAAIELIPTISTDPDKMVDLGSASKAAKTFEQIMSVPSGLITTPEEAKAVENLNLVMKPIEMSGEGWRLIGEAANKGLKELGFEDTYIEPLFATYGEAAAIFGLPGLVKSIGRSTTFRRMTIPERNLMVQDIADMVKNNPNLSEGEILRKAGPESDIWKSKLEAVRGKRPAMEEPPPKPEDIIWEEVPIDLGEPIAPETEAAKVPRETLPAIEPEPTPELTPEPATPQSLADQINQEMPGHDLAFDGEFPKGALQFTPKEGPAQGASFYLKKGEENIEALRNRFQEVLSNPPAEKPEVPVKAEPGAVKEEEKAAPESAVERQPWEMKKEEWEGNQPAGRQEWIRVRLAEKGISTQPTSQKGKLLFQKEWRSAADEYDKEFSGRHEKIIRQALSEGKPIPPEVLADYPDLAKEPAPKAEGVWDAATEKHFQDWLERTVHEDERDTVESGIRAIVKEDPSILADKGWPEIRRMAEAETTAPVKKEKVEGEREKIGDKVVNGVRHVIYQHEDGSISVEMFNEKTGKRVGAKAEPKGKWKALKDQLKQPPEWTELEEEAIQLAPATKLGKRGNMILKHANGTVYESSVPTHSLAFDQFPGLEPDDVIDTGIRDDDGSIAWIGYGKQGKRKPTKLETAKIKHKAAVREKKKRAAPEPQSFRQWIARTGGVRITDPARRGDFKDIRWKISGGKRVNVLPPGMLRKQARATDERLTDAIESGWLPPWATEQDFMEAIYENPRKRYVDRAPGENLDKEIQEGYDYILRERYGTSNTEELERNEQYLADQTEAAAEVESEIRGELQDGRAEEIAREEGAGTKNLKDVPAWLDDAVDEARQAVEKRLKQESLFEKEKPTPTPTSEKTPKILQLEERIRDLQKEAFEAAKGNKKDVWSDAFQTRYQLEIKRRTPDIQRLEAEIERLKQTKSEPETKDLFEEAKKKEPKIAEQADLTAGRRPIQQPYRGGISTEEAIVRTGAEAPRKGEMPTWIYDVAGQTATIRAPTKGHAIAKIKKVYGVSRINPRHVLQVHPEQKIEGQKEFGGPITLEALGKPGETTTGVRGVHQEAPAFREAAEGKGSFVGEGPLEPRKQAELDRIRTEAKKQGITPEEYVDGMKESPAVKTALREMVGEEKPDLTYSELNKQVKEFKGTGGIASEAKPKGFLPGFMDRETGIIYSSTYDTGEQAGVHLLDGLPNEVVTKRNTHGEIEAVKASIEPGFIKNGEFYTRNALSGAMEKTKPSLLATAREIDPAPNALISIRELRAKSGMDKAAFDREVLAMAQRGEVFLHRHVHPGSLSTTEKLALVRDKGDYYMGLVLRK